MVAEQQQSKLSRKGRTAKTVTLHTTDAHDPLADVILPGEPVPIRYGLHELDHFEAVCKYNNKLGRPWNGKKLEALLDGLTEAAEAAQVVREASLTSPTAVEKESVRILIRKGHSIIDIPALLGIDSLFDVAFALCNGRMSGPMVHWTANDWLAFEADLDGEMGATELSRTHGISRTLVYRLKNLYGGKPGWKG